MSDAKRIVGPDRFGPDTYRSADPPLVLQSKAHRDMVEALLPFWAKASPAVRRAIEKLAACGTWNGVSYTPAGFPARYRCRQHICRHCGDKWKRKTASAMARDVRDLSDPDFGNARRATLNLAVVNERDVATAVGKVRAVLTGLFKRELEKFALVGGFDFALKPGGRVMVHIHAVLIGPRDGLEQAQSILRGICTGFRRFSVDQVRDRLDDQRDGPTTWLSYALDTALTAPKHNRRPRWDHHSLAAPEEKLRWVELHAGLRNQKGNPIRLTLRLGVRKMVNRKRDGKPKTARVFGILPVWTYDNLLQFSQRGPIPVLHWSRFGKIRGEMYRHLFRQEPDRRPSEPSADSSGQFARPSGPGDGPADVRHAMTWTTPARGPPEVRSGDEVGQYS